MLRPPRDSGSAEMIRLPTDGVTYLVGGPSIDGPLLDGRPFAPYAPIVCEFLEELSSTLLGDPAARAFSDVSSFAYWCRPSHIQRLSDKFLSQKNRSGVGVVFHITPSNVPVNFAFSFVFGLLAGNANMVRIPSKKYPEVDVILAAIAKLFQKGIYGEVRDRTAFMRYEASDELTVLFSTLSRARMIWGGDETVSHLRAIPASARCMDLTFANRYSLSILDGKAVVKLSESELDRLAERFYNDTFVLDQNACSSPQAVFWIGEIAPGFWTALDRWAQKKYQLELSTVMDKYVQFCDDAVRMDGVSLKRYSNYVNVVTVAGIDTSRRGSCGYFYQARVENLDSALLNLGEVVQTVTCFGIKPQDIIDRVLALHIAGVDRVVPVGKALDIGVIWDGMDIVGSLSRIIDDTVTP